MSCHLKHEVKGCPFWRTKEMSQCTAGRARYSLRSADRRSTRSSRLRSALSSRTRPQTKSSRPTSSRKRTSTTSRRTNTSKTLDLTLPLKDLRYRDLAKECKKRGLKVRGKKTDLIAMLLEEGYGGLNIKTRLFSADDRKHDHDGSLSVSTVVNREETKEAPSDVAKKKNEDTSKAIREVTPDESKGEDNDSITNDLVDGTAPPTSGKRPGDDLDDATRQQEQNVQQSGGPGAGLKPSSVGSTRTVKIKKLRLTSRGPFQPPAQATESIGDASPPRYVEVPIPAGSAEQDNSFSAFPRLADSAAAAKLPLSANGNQATLSAISFQSATHITHESAMPPPSPPAYDTDPRLQRLEVLQRIYENSKTEGASEKQIPGFVKPPVAPMTKPGYGTGTNRLACGAPSVSAQGRKANAGGIVCNDRPESVSTKGGCQSFERTRTVASNMLKSKVSASQPYLRTSGSVGLSTPLTSAKPQSPTGQSPIILRNLPTPERTLQTLLKASPVADSELRQNSMPGVRLFADREERNARGSLRRYSTMASGVQKRRSWSSDVQVRSLPVGDVVKARALKIERGMDWAGKEGRRAGSVGRDELLRKRLKNINEDVLMNAADKIGEMAQAALQKCPFPKPGKKRERLKKILRVRRHKA